MSTFSRQGGGKSRWMAIVQSSDDNLFAAIHYHEKSLELRFG